MREFVPGYFSLSKLFSKRLPLVPLLSSSYLRWNIFYIVYYADVMNFERHKMDINFHRTYVIYTIHTDLFNWHSHSPSTKWLFYNNGNTIWPWFNFITFIHFKFIFCSSNSNWSYKTEHLFKVTKMWPLAFG